MGEERGSAGTLHRLGRLVYDATLRGRLPRSWGVYNGVPARRAGYLDLNLHKRHHKAGLIDAIHERVEEGTTVTLVALGWGISSVHAVRAGARRVVAYEAAGEMIPQAEETLRANQCRDRVEIVHAIVGEVIDAKGAVDGAPPLAPEEMELGEVLVLDCEGAERSILRGLVDATDRPSVIVVETHPDRGVPTEETRELLVELGYAVVERPYEPGRDDGKRVLVGDASEETPDAT